MLLLLLLLMMMMCQPSAHHDALQFTTVQSVVMGVCLVTADHVISMIATSTDSLHLLLPYLGSFEVSQVTDVVLSALIAISVTDCIRNCKYSNSW